jgi:two-component system, NtrC family, sensor kinase
MLNPTVPPQPEPSSTAGTQQAVVKTIAAKCRRCYHCVRHCPAKAIRVHNGQAEVLPERCIGCGRCVRVCAQQAKQIEPGCPRTLELLVAETPVVLMLAPSYPAAFPAVRAGQVVAAARELGFDQVLEVGYGAELVARQYARLSLGQGEGTIVTTACPALVSYVRKHLPELAPRLAPIVSPMVALGRAVKSVLLPEANVVFAGPCIAKKAECRDPSVAGAVDVVLTFAELAELFAAARIDLAALRPAAADEPLPHCGSLFPVSGGLLKTAGIECDLLADEVVVVDGDVRALGALRSLAEGSLEVSLLDALLCEGGCVGGPALPGLGVAARHLVTAHARQQAREPRPMARRLLSDLEALDMSCTYDAQPLHLPVPTEKEIRDLLARQNKNSVEDELNCGACGYATCRDKVTAVYQGLAESEMCLPFLIQQLEVNVERLTRSKEEVEKARALATRTQHLAAMGELAADVAEQVSRPLGNLAAYGELLRDSLATEDARRQDVEAIISEAQVCREVMVSLEGFARRRSPQWETVQLAQVVERALREVEPRLAGRPVNVVRQLAPDLPAFLADPAMLAQVLVRLLANSIEAIDDHGTVTVSGRVSDDHAAMEIAVADDGRGIPEDLLPRIFQPFVTTKAKGTAAGLGLAAAHGIVQSHHGEIHIDSTPGAGTTVTVRIPFEQGITAPRQAVKVLVVDDDPDMLEIHRLLLTEAGFDVVAAERSDEALELANSEIPDAFVLDLIMEKADSGARLARALRRDPRFRKAPVVMATSVVQDMGFEFVRNPKEVLEWMRADAWIDKPVDGPRLAATIERILAERRSERAAQ